MKVQNESGRSMAEMVVVLFIIGILTTIAISGIRWVINTAKANKIMESITQELAMFSPETDTDFPNNSPDINCSVMANPRFFVCISPNISKGLCQRILGMNWTEPINIFPQTCEETNNMAFTFARDSKNSATICTDSTSCPLLQDSCTYGVCITPTPQTCNPSNERPCADGCSTCNETTLLCENACVRKSYLQSNGKQWINTGIIPTSDTQIETKFRFISGTFGQKTTAYEYLNGVTGGSATNPRMAWGYTGAVSTSQIYVGISNVNSYTTGCSVALDTDYSLTFNGSGYISCNGHEKNISVNHPINQTLPIHLFARRNASSNNNKPFSGRIYFTKIKQNNSVVRDFVPVLSPTNKPCMYDKVSGTLFCNQGSGAFTTD